MRNALPLLLALALAGCAANATVTPGVETPVEGATLDADAEVVTGEAPMAGMLWTSTLTADPAFPSVRATAQASSTPDGTAVAVNVAGAPAGGTHPWHLHTGSCGSDGAVVGDASAYSPLRPGADGTATANTTLDTELAMGQEYHVQLRAGAGMTSPVIACGDLVHAM